MLAAANIREDWLTSEPWPPPLDQVERACLGDPAASEAIYRAMQPRLNAFLRYHGFDQATREDIASEISEVVLTKIMTLRKPVTFEAWFWAIARNRIRGWLRRKQRDSKRTVPLTPDPTPPDETVVIREEHLTMRRALAGLSATDRHLLWLREIEGLSHKDISGRLGAPAGAIRVRCHRARQRLAAAYEDAVTNGGQEDDTTDQG